MTEPSDTDYGHYFSDDGQAVRRGVVLTDAELRDYRAYFPDEQYTAPTTITEENQ